jgi:hypothetical protein
MGILTIATARETADFDSLKENLTNSLRYATCSSASKSFSQTLIDTCADGVKKVSYHLSAVGYVTMGVRPDPYPGGAKGYDDNTPDYSSSCLPQYSASWYTSIGCQCEQLSNQAIPSLINDINEVCDDLDTMRKQVRGTCPTCPTLAQCQALVANWTSVQNVAVLGIPYTRWGIDYGSIIAYPNLCDANFTSTFNSTLNFLKNYKECKICMVNRVHQDQVRLTPKCDSRGSSGSGESSYSCAEQTSRMNIRRSKIAKKKTFHKRKRGAVERAQLKSQVEDVIKISINAFYTSTGWLYDTCTR